MLVSIIARLIHVLLVIVMLMGLAVLGLTAARATDLLATPVINPLVCTERDNGSGRPFWLWRDRCVIAGQQGCTTEWNV